MNKRNILNDLNNFIDSDYNIILLDGPWGSGKTFLLNEYVKANEDKGVRFYYVSLHGMKNIDEINTNLLPDFSAGGNIGAERRLEHHNSETKSSGTNLTLSYELDLFGRLDAERL